MERIILVRHTETEGGDMKIYRGITDLDLLPEGFEHAKKLGRLMKDIPVDKIYTSNLKRAFHTAEEIAKFHNLKIIKNAQINELNFGVLDGMKVVDAKSKYPKIVEKREAAKNGSLEDYMNYRFPKGESYADVRKRGLSFILNEAKKNPGKTLMFVVHGSLMKSILAYVMKKNIDQINNMLKYGCRVFLTHENGRLSFERIENDIKGNRPKSP
jgi:broad specificity phosphatase PhoE